MLMPHFLSPTNAFWEKWRGRIWRTAFSYLITMSTYCCSSTFREQREAPIAHFSLKVTQSQWKVHTIYDRDRNHWLFALNKPQTQGNKISLKSSDWIKLDPANICSGTGILSMASRLALLWTEYNPCRRTNQENEHCAFHISPKA